MDLQMKFEASTGYVYSESDIIHALEAKYRQWDIVLRSFDNIYETEIVEAIEQFRDSFLIQIKDSTLEYFYLTYEDMAKQENEVDIETFYECIEPNRFITYAYRQYINKQKI